MYIAECVSGVARAYTAVLECPTLATVGQSILEVLMPIIARRESETNACLDGVGTEDGLLHPQSAAATRTGSPRDRGAHRGPLAGPNAVQASHALR